MRFVRNKSYLLSKIELSQREDLALQTAGLIPFLGIIFVFIGGVILLIRGVLSLINFTVSRLGPSANITK